MIINTMDSKVVTMKDAIEKYVEDGSTIYFGGFFSHVCYAAAHEIIRQNKKNITLVHHSVDLVGDMLVGTGCSNRVLTSYCSDEYYGQCYAFRRAVEEKEPQEIEVEDYSMGVLNFRLHAAALNSPFIPIKSMLESDMVLPALGKEEKIRMAKDPFTGKSVPVVKALHPEIAIIHAQLSDVEGNAQSWGISESMPDGVDASQQVIVVTEKIVEGSVLRKFPNLTIVPSFKTVAVIHEPWGCHPTYLPDFYKIDKEFRVYYHEQSKTAEGFQNFVEEWITGTENHSEYLKKLGESRLHHLRIKSKFWRD
jgi:glutaconate CoA-transferase subunit A